MNYFCLIVLKNLSDWYNNQCSKTLFILLLVFWRKQLLNLIQGFLRPTSGAGTIRPRTGPGTRPTLFLYYLIQVKIQKRKFSLLFFASQIMWR